MPNEEYHELDNLEDLTISDGGSGTFTGTLKILPSVPDQTADLIIKLRPGPAARSLQFNNQKFSTIKPSFNHFKRYPIPYLSSCLPADVTLHFRENLVLSNLNIKTQHGKIQIHSPLKISNSTTITTKTGTLQTTNFLNSRRTYISTGSSSFKGTIRLYDLISITSSSGSVDVDIDPQGVDKDHKKPAELVIVSQSGSVKVHYPTANLPDREYISTITSTGGSVDATLVHGKSTTIRNTSGSMNVDLIPYIQKSAASRLDVHSQSGSQKVHLFSPLSGSLDNLKSVHTAQSGRLVLEYPDEWEGKINGQTSSGSLSLSGSGVEIIESGGRSSGKYVIARKGDGSSKLEFTSASGSADVRVGF